MERYTDFDFNNLCSVPVRKQRTLYDDNILTLDFEVTSVFIHDGKYSSFDYSKPPEYYKEFDKCGIVYIWQLSINEDVLYGRTLEELQECFILIREKLLGRIIIYIHNLAYEFQFLRNIIFDFEVFARKPRHPMKAYTESLNIEFRCSLTLTNMSLESLPKNLGLNVTKKVGQLDYNKLRLPCTELTPAELEYCEFDCIVLYEAIKKHKEEYNHVYNIPLTQTGKLRNVVKGIYKGNTSYYRRISNMLPTTFEEFNTLCGAYSGGYTHANAIYTRDILSDVYSQDITSSYPTVMVAELFPMSKFVKTRITDIDKIDTKNAYVIDITFFHLRAKMSCTYLSKSKAVRLYDCTEDNGRIVLAEMARFLLTEIDLDIVRQVYDFDYEINEVVVAHKERLDTNFVRYILELYANKTIYKGITDKADLYLQSKQYINSMYGMCVTNTIRDEVIFADDWETVTLTREDTETKLVKLTQKHRTFLNYAWGVWITAYARQNLWKVMVQMSDDVVYCDTDSIKYIQESNNKYFESYNKDIVKLLNDAVTYHELDPKLINPQDSKGIYRPLGVYDYEGKYDKFVTLGAKKYCVLKAGELEVTISGVNKHKGSERLTDITEFKEDLLFDYDHSGRLILTYNDNQPHMDIVDYMGKMFHVEQLYGINLMPTTYTLGLSTSYDDYLIRLSGQFSTHATLITGKEDLTDDETGIL